MYSKNELAQAHESPAKCAYEACRKPIQYGQTVYEHKGLYYCQAECLAAAIGANYVVFIHPEDR